MCGTGSVGGGPTIATNTTPLAGGGASTTTTSVAGAAGGGALPAVPGAVAGVTGGGADSLASLLTQVTAAVQALQQALSGGGLLGSTPPTPGVEGGGPAQVGGCGCGMPGCGDAPTQLPPTPIQTPEQTPEQKTDGDKGEKKDKKAKKKTEDTGAGGDKGGPGKAGKGGDKDTPPPPPPTGGGADAAPETPPAGKSQTQLIQDYKQKYWAWEALYTQRKALSAEIADLKRQRDQFTSGGPDAMARNRLTQQINAKQKTYDEGFAAINAALTARNDAFRAAGLPRAIHPNELP